MMWLALISTFLMRCYMPRRLVLAASGDDLFHVLNMLLGSIHGFLHQPFTTWSMAFSSISFLTMTPVLFNKAVVSSCSFALPAIFALSRSCSVWSFALCSPSPRMTPVAFSNEAFISSYRFIQPKTRSIRSSSIARMRL